MTTRRDILKYGAAAGLTSGLSTLPKLAMAQDGPLKVAAVYASPVSEIGWTKQHSLGLDAIKAAMGDGVETTAIDSIYIPQDAERVFRQLASEGNRLIFGTSFSHGTPMQRVAPRFADLAFEHCSGIVSLDNLGIFDAKYHEGSYVAGVAAGLASPTGKIGFIGGFPVPAVVTPCNALLRGVQSVNPDATCNVIFLNSWFDPGKEKEAANTLLAQGCDVICSMTDTATAVQVAGEAGVWSIGYASDMSQFANGKQLTAFILNWAPVYVKAAQDVAAGTWAARDRWMGLAEGIVQMAPYNESLSADQLALIRKAEADVASGAVTPFSGPLMDQSGAMRVEAGGVLPDPDARGMNWFVKGMVGNLS